MLVFPTIKYLMDKGMLTGIGVLERYRKFLHQPLLKLGVPDDKITFFKKQDWLTQKQNWLNQLQPDAVWVFGFPWRLPNQLLSMPHKGFYNFHFGLFPKYKGGDPVFWQIKNRESKAGLVIHKMTEEVDGGPIVWREEVPLFPGETHGLYCTRMGTVTVNVLDKFLTQEETYTEQVDANNEQYAAYLKKPTATELTINWANQTADEIEALVNAANPMYGGAATALRGMDIKLLEVAPTDLKDAPESAPGTIMYADTLYGLIVACKGGQFLKINIASTREGFLSGGKLFNLGVKAGERFSEVDAQPATA